VSVLILYQPSAKSFDRLAQILPQLRHLVHLDVEEAEFSSQSLECTLECCGLKTLRLAESDVSTLVSVFVEHLKKLKRLHSLTLAGLALNDEDLDLIVTGSIQHLPLLRLLSFKGCEVGTATGKALSNFLTRSSLKELDLSFTLLPESGTAPILQALKTSKLESLQIASADFNSGELAKALSGSSLLKLNISHSQLNESDGSKLASGIANSQLTFLDVSWNDMESGMAKVAESVLKSSTISHFFFRNTEVESTVFNSLLQSVGRRLSDLDFSHVPFRQEALPTLINALTSNAHLTSLRLGPDGQINDQKFFSALSTCKNLKKLVLEQLDFQFQDLASALTDSSLSTLHITQCFSGLSGTALGSFLASSKVTDLSLCESNFDAEDATVFASFIPKSRLRLLDLSHNPVQAQGANALAEVFPNTQLVYVKLQSCKVFKPSLKLSSASTLYHYNCFDYISEPSAWLASIASS
jgi:hypothetical protein